MLDLSGRSWSMPACAARGAVATVNGVVGHSSAETHTSPEDTDQRSPIQAYTRVEIHTAVGNWLPQRTFLQSIPSFGATAMHPFNE